MPQLPNTSRLVRAVKLYESGMTLSKVGQEMGGISKQAVSCLVRRGREMLENKATDKSSHKQLANRPRARIEYAVELMGVHFIDGNIPADFVADNIDRKWFKSLPLVGPVSISQIDDWLAANGEVWE